jgi:hypothetical protein
MQNALSFIKDKIIVRSLVALTGPLILYSVGFAAAKALDGNNAFQYFNLNAWLVLVGVSCIYPVNKVGLMITLVPIERLFNWMMKVDNTDDFALRGNYAPVKKDLMHEIVPSLIKEGAVPKDINGVFLRNGPNPVFMPSHGRHHWFDGDGRIHGFRIKDGKAYYCTK